MMNLLIVLLTVVFSFQPLHAKPIANNFIEMNVPDDWNCAPYGDLWTCLPLDPANAKEAIIVFSFAEQSPSDSMKFFYDYLSNSMTMTNPATKKVEKSVPKNMQYKDIQGQTWVDSLHLSQAIPNYYTRYLATIKDGRSVLVSVTVDKAKYNLYMATLYKVIESIRLRVAAPAAPLETGLTGFLGDKVKEAGKEKSKTIAPIVTKPKSKLPVVILSLLIALLVFIVVVRRMKQKRNKLKNKSKGGFFK